MILCIIREVLAGAQVLISLRGLSLNRRLLPSLRVAPKMIQLWVGAGAVCNIKGSPTVCPAAQSSH